MTTYVWRCPHCGRTWDTRGWGTSSRARWSSGAPIGANTGFVISAAKTHMDGCSRATPAERRTVNARDEKRWAKSPPVASRITNDPDHPGLRDQGLTMPTPTLNEARHALASAIRNQGAEWKIADLTVKALEASWGPIPDAEKVQRLIAAADNYGEL